MTVYEQTAAAAAEICERAHLQPGSILVVGCSTSEVVGSKIGTNSSVETAGEIARALLDVTGSRGIFLAVQCCEHLNRAIITERAAVPGAEIVNVVPQPKAGGSLATQVYAALKEPVALEEIKADAGLDIGLTLIGMGLIWYPTIRSRTRLACCASTKFISMSLACLMESLTAVFVISLNVIRL